MLRLVSLLVLSGSMFAADPDYAKELPRIPPTEPDKALATFVVKPGYRLQQVAAEPLLASPVAVAWDENSRLFVVEMRGYSENRDEKLSRVSMLTSSKNDGVYDRATVFADGFLWPTAVACWDGGIFVGDAPHIYYLKDTNGDGKADVRTIVYSGFGVHNVQGLLNSFHWTIDNQIHGTGSSCGGIITRPDEKSFKPVPISGRDFEFDPRTRLLRATSGGAQHGMTFDDFGHKFASSNSDHVQQVLYEDRLMARNPFFTPPPPRVSIASDGPQAEVFPTAPVEPWRAVRTRLRVQGTVPGIVEGGGRATGYFTGATGLTIYRGDAAPDLKGLAFVGDACSSFVHRKTLTLVDGVQYRADRIDKDSEFVGSKDNWFRPVQFANGPDGCLTIIDMYRETIEHPASIPPVIKKHLDLTSGRDRGRLYRVMPTNHTPRTLPKLGTAPTAELVKLLDHPNAWHRETASRLLIERNDKTAIELLRKQLTAKGVFGPIHAMWTLHSLGELTMADAKLMMRSKEPRVREQLARAIPRIAKDGDEGNLLYRLANDADPQVRYQAAFHVPMVYPKSALFAPTATDSKYVRAAIISSMADVPGLQLTTFLSVLPETPMANVRPFVQDMVSLFARRDRFGDGLEIAESIRTIAATDATFALSLLKIVNEVGKPRVKSQVAAAFPAEQLRTFLQTALADAKNPALSAASRAEAIRTLSLGQLADVREPLMKFLDLKQPAEVQLAALATLDRFGDAEVAKELLKQWPTLSPRLRAAASESILSRPDRVKLLLEAVEAKTFSPTNLDGTQIKRLLAHKDAAIQAKATTLLAKYQPARRTDVIAKYRPALEMTGDPTKGKQIFMKSCAACHKLEGVGNELGPNLSAMKNRGPEAILLNVLDPNLEVNPLYVNYTCNTLDGRTITGMIQSETATSVTFVRGEGQKDTIARSDIETLKNTGQSLMPEGIEKDIPLAAMADLIAYLMRVP